MNKNDIIEIEITGTSHDGSGVARYNGQVIFIAGAVEGEYVKARIEKVQKNLLYGRITEMLKPSVARIEPDCTVYTRCGGCVFRHINYQEELRIKENHVRETLRRIGGIDTSAGSGTSVEPIIGAEKLYNYRNKIQLPVREEDGRLMIGFFMPRSHRIAEISDGSGTSVCHIDPAITPKVVNILRGWMTANRISAYDEIRHCGLIRHMIIRVGDGAVMVCVVINGVLLPDSAGLINELRKEIKGLSSVVVNINKTKNNVILGNEYNVIWGSEYITECLDGLEFRISPLSFFQINTAQTVKLYKKAVEFTELTPRMNLLDLYCGAGTISLFMAREANHVIGIESVEDAVRDAKANALHNNVNNAEFICGLTENKIGEFIKNNKKIDVITLDPPRKGCDTRVIDAMLELRPRRIVYISCDPATLSRDLKLLCGGGYNLSRVQPVDMFPRTSHVECVARLDIV